ncbi:hypothetical protein HanIR_Chr09g0404591 [Helianthus annuus]|nr:hypothetical protein HanIR_Chr09g0404591 [Helianthus annuus]
MQLQDSESSSNTRDIDQSNNFPSFLKLIEEDDLLFLFKDDWDKKTEPKGKASVLL